MTTATPWSDASSPSSKNPADLDGILRHSAKIQRAKVLVVVEGVQNAKYLRRFSELLAQENPDVPDLQRLEGEGAVVFAPMGGGRLSGCSHRFASLGLAELHVYVRESPPVTVERLSVAAAVNGRPRCAAYVTRRRGMENYLHPEAVREVLGGGIEFGDDDDVPGAVVDALFPCYRRSGPVGTVGRQRKKLRDRIKRVLCTRGLDHMTAPRLAESDPDGDVLGWLTAVRRLLAG